MSAIDALVKHHLDNVCKEIDKSNCAFVKDLAAIRSDLAQAQRERDRARASLRTMLYIFDRELPDGTIGRQTCDEARSALNDAERKT
jgi:hypothetical protein